METKARKLLKKVERLIEENEYNLVKLRGVLIIERFYRGVENYV